MVRALVFDSGVGGLTIVQEVRKAAPHWAVDYAADSGFFPYGVKSDDELRGRLPGLCAALVEIARPDVLVVACNTASTLSLQDIRARVAIPVVGTVPAIKPAADLTRTGVIGVLATPGTVRRLYLDELERRFAAGKTVVRLGSAGLVDLAERAARGQAGEPAEVRSEVRSAIGRLFGTPTGARIDVVVLACTHFPLLREEIAAACPSGVILVDTGAAVARQVLRVAPAQGSGVNVGPATAYVTGGAANRAAMAPALNRYGYDLIEVVDL
ncbi:MAG: glutamate racemase [Alphaproteobacteria bacterium]|nr:glutamate racemase [Alphaproteobacteria bacterium]